MAKGFSVITGQYSISHVGWSFWQGNPKYDEGLDGEVSETIMSAFFFTTSMIGSTAMLDLVIKEVDDINFLDESGNTALLNTFNLPYMEIMYARSVFNESNFDYLIEKGAKVSIESLQKAMLFANMIAGGGEKNMKKYLKKSWILEWIQF